MAATTDRDVGRMEAGRVTVTTDSLVTEAPLEIRMAGTPLAVLMRTPGDEADLVLGFAITEGMVLSPAEVAGVEPVAGDPERNRWELRLAPGAESRGHGLPDRESGQDDSLSTDPRRPRAARARAIERVRALPADRPGFHKDIP